ncbi:hypothetical protein H257_13353 [Aphanomyces astaci]|uniref:Uncharacterized protein n=1 Tax=Aphanomyces astaci TaxID=112090 RepID=W4FVD9_APHAT|nr:hypothetical protein H257_13353 [Aphanomyces astaci]ETV71480.1 hypothetical protein H257_13353 [Aphanomyces astaci]|eukprot:XP_009839145.1 hypothetical protein H257_13353 [Aphanomyces astaci]
MITGPSVEFGGSFSDSGGTGGIAQLRRRGASSRTLGTFRTRRCLRTAGSSLSGWLEYWFSLVGVAPATSGATRPFADTFPLRHRVAAYRLGDSRLSRTPRHLVRRTRASYGGHRTPLPRPMAMCRGVGLHRCCTAGLGTRRFEKYWEVGV